MEMLVGLFLLILVNSIGFLVTQMMYTPETKIKIVRRPHHKKMAYFIGGSFEDFKFLESEISDGIALVQYSNSGWNVEEMADCVLGDIIMSGYQARIYTLSVGDRVGRLIDTIRPTDKVEIVAVNPCSSPTLLWPEVRARLETELCVAELGCLLLGFFSTASLLRRGQEKISLVLARDLLRGLLQEDDCGGRNGSTRGVLVSTLDELTNPKRVTTFFRGVPIAFVEAKHAESSSNPQAYQSAYRRIVR